jgi:putative ABC transport system permease protein
MTNLWQDVRYALRMLARNPGFTAVMIAILAVGVGANTAVFCTINATFLRTLPYEDPDLLLMVMERGNSGDIGVSYPDFVDWCAQQDVFSGLAFYHTESAKLKTSQTMELVSTCLVSSDFFSVLGVDVVQGRGLIAEDDRVGAASVAWVSHETWQKYFAGDGGPVGRMILLNGQAVTVAGILPARFRFHRRADFYLPIAPYAEQLFLTMRENHNDAYTLGRLKAGVTPMAAQAQMSAIAKRIEQQYPKINAGIGTRVASLHEQLAGQSRAQLFLLLGAVGTVLLIACVNVANMLLSRSFSRHREMAIRTAVGASHVQLFRQLLVESLVLAAAGGVAGTALGLWGYEFGRRLVPWELQPLVESAGGFDWRVLLFIAGITLATGVGFGLAPAWQLSHANPNNAIKNTRRTVRTLFGRTRLSNLLVVGQTAMALILLVGAGLMIRSLQQLLQVPSGIRPERVLTLQVTPPSMAQFQRDPYSVSTFYDRLIDAVSVLPQVETAAATTALPFTWNTNHMVFFRDGRPIPAPAELPSASTHTVSPDYFRAMGVPLLRGRYFDGLERQPVIPPGVDLSPQNLSLIYKDVVFDGIISQRMAEKYWPDEDPIGKRFRLGFPDMQLPWVQIVGVVGNTTQTGLDQGESSEFYLSLRQFPSPVGMYLVVRTRMDPAAVVASILTAIQSVASDEPIHDVKLMSERMDESLSGRRFNMNLFSLFAGTALLLSVIGVYGVLSFVVGQRVREVGIRMALGARRWDVLRDVLACGLRLVVPGILIGLAGAWATSRFLRSQLFGITGVDPVTYLACTLLLVGVAMAACLIPAHRAAKIDPMVALRCE